MKNKNFIEIVYKDRGLDAIGAGVAADIKEDLLILAVSDVSYIDRYELSMELDDKKLEEIAKHVFLDPIIQSAALNKPFSEGFDWEIIVRYNPDVTDNVGETARLAVRDFLKTELAEDASIRHARKYLVKGKLTEKDVERICSGLLANSTIEKYTYRKL